MRRVTRPRSRRSSACRSMGGGKRTCRVERKALWGAGRSLSGFVGGSALLVVPGGGTGMVEMVFRRAVTKCRGVGRVLVMMFVG